MCIVHGYVFMNILLIGTFTGAKMKAYHVCRITFYSSLRRLQMHNVMAKNENCVLFLSTLRDAKKKRYVNCDIVFFFLLHACRSILKL
jgi:hypothetical protein